MTKDLGRLRSTPSVLRSAGNSELGNPIFKGLGIVFGGKDLYGDTFSPPRERLAGDDPDLKIGTEYYLSELADNVNWETGEISGALAIPVFWDHGLGALGTKRLGRAIPFRITQEGIEYLIEIELERAKDYQELIDVVYEYKFLGLSSQTLPSFANFDWSTSEIKSWYPAEMTLTVVPAEHRTRDSMERMRSMLRKYGIEEDMFMTQKTQDVDVQDDIEQVDVEEEENIDDATAVVDDLLQDLDTVIEGEETALAENEMLTYVVRYFDELSERIGAMEAQLSRMATTEEVAQLDTQVSAMGAQFSDAIKSLGTGLSEALVKAVRGRAAQIVRDSSEFEIDAMRNLDQPEPSDVSEGSLATRSYYNLPPNAPGQVR